MIEGSCLCGDVRYEAEALTSTIALCHCRTCRKAHATAYAATARVARSGFKWTSGADLVAAFESTPGKLRWFCPRCGSHLMAEWTAYHEVILRLGSVDTPLDARPEVHIWMSHALAALEAPPDMPMLLEGRPG